jgi:dTDP-4-amino-4,6-dideoxygalactose transaminase
MQRARGEVPEPVPFLDLVTQYRGICAEIDAAIRGVLESGRFVEGPATRRFEEAFARYCGVRHAVGVGNGTDALALALRALGVGAGDEVLVPALTFVATAEAVLLAGATPRLVDVGDGDALIDPARAEEAMGPRARALLSVHLYGQLAPMSDLLEIAGRRGLAVVEDAAQAHGASLAGRRAGAFGAAAGFSFYPGKNLGAYGDAGAVVTDDAEVADRIRRTANHGRIDWHTHEAGGLNSRLDALQAAVLEVKLRHLDAWNARRRARARRYDEALRDLEGVRRLHDAVSDAHVFHLYVVRVADRDALAEHLRRRGVQVGVHYPTPLHQQPALGALGHGRGDFPVSERLASEILSLPLWPEMTDAQQDRVVAALREFFGRGA